MKYRARSIFTRVFRVLALTFSIYAIAAFFVIVIAALRPVALSSADDLASLILLSAETWVYQPETARADYAKRIWDSNRILLTADRPLIEEDEVFFLPYLRLVKDALARRTGHTFDIKSDIREDGRWFWVDLEISRQPLRVGFPRDRLGTAPVNGILVVFVVAMLLIIIASLLLAHRTTRPLKSMSEALDEVGRGQIPGQLARSGVKEIDRFVDRINELGRQVRELLDNRTTLLGGISHDLRTPLTRMRLAVEMIEEECDSALTDQMKIDIAQMNDMITESMSLCRSLEQLELEETDLADEVGQVVELFASDGQRVNWSAEKVCRCELNATAFRRMLQNIVENALRYGEDKPVDIGLYCDSERKYLEIADRGVGIPEASREDIFRPFYRLEKSRNARTGGSGLGLAIANQLATANGCRIEVDDRPGGGTVFRVFLPVKEQNPGV